MSKAFLCEYISTRFSWISDFTHFIDSLQLFKIPVELLRGLNLEWKVSICVVFFTYFYLPECPCEIRCMLANLWEKNSLTQRTIWFAMSNTIRWRDSELRKGEGEPRGSRQLSFLLCGRVQPLTKSTLQMSRRPIQQGTVQISTSVLTYRGPKGFQTLKSHLKLYKCHRFR